MSKIIHFEIPASDIKRMIEFYSKAFGWKIEQWDGEEYWLVTAGSADDPGINGAIYLKDWMKTVVDTISVKNLDEVIKKITENGGQIIKEPTDIPEVGKHAYFRDPEGTLMGIMETYG